MLNKIILLVSVICFANNFSLKAENGSTRSITIPVGTSIPLILNYSINSKEAKQGNIIDFEVAQDIYINEQVAIPMGTAATAEIIKASKRKCWGKPGKLVIRIKELQLSNGTKIPLTAPDIEKRGISKKGDAWTWFWCTIMFIPLNTIPPLCIKGENAIIENGLTIIANTTESAIITR